MLMASGTHIMSRMPLLFSSKLVFSGDGIKTLDFNQESNLFTISYLKNTLAIVTPAIPLAPLRELYWRAAGNVTIKIWDMF
jgi:hypothetical protein